MCSLECTCVCVVCVCAYVCPCVCVQGSYLFAKRPLTAALQGAREQGHLEELRDQLLSQRSHSRRAQQETLLLERVDQAQLAHE